MTSTSRERPSDPPATWTPNWTPPAQLSASETQRAPVLSGLSRVGETGFEPATARPPAGCATRLRHSPWCVLQSGRRESNPPYELGRLGCNHNTSPAKLGAILPPWPPLLRRDAADALVDQRRGRPGPVPVVAGPVERHDRSAEPAPQGRGQKGDQPGVLLGTAEPAERHRARRARPDDV